MCYKNSGCDGNLHFPYTYNGENEIDNFVLRLSQWGYLEFFLTGIFIEKFLTIVQIAGFDWLPGRQKELICEKIFKNLLIRNHKVAEAGTLHTCNITISTISFISDEFPYFFILRIEAI